jgi:predicted MPP superfamily phosphohydrolase
MAISLYHDGTGCLRKEGNGITARRLRPKRHPLYMTRRTFVYSCLGVSGVAASYPCYCEPRWLEVTERRANLLRVPLTEPIRILHLSDLHLSPVVPLSLIESAVTLGLAQKPDLVCLTGDFITGSEDLSSGAYARVLSRLSDHAPTFAVLGNHDGGSWAHMSWGYPDHRVVEGLLDRSRIELLHNRAIRVQVRASMLSIVGVGDLWSDEIEKARAFSGLDLRVPIVLLSHNPDSKDVLGSALWDLMLSGHTHGGQVILPFQGPRYAPVEDKRYVAGLKAWGARLIHVTRGVGSLGGVRFRCRPEVSLLVVG